MKILIFLSFFFSALSVFSQSDAFRMKQYNLDDHEGIKGYDPVCYFTENKAVKGEKELVYSYHGIVYHFATGADMELFKADPSKYEPQYGGWCAYSMGHDGSKVIVDPATFKIINGRLYLFYNWFFNNTLKSWNKNEANLLVQADANWQKILQK
jgi:YHS domain-containing protein